VTIFMFEAGRRGKRGFLSYTVSPVSRRIMRTEKTAFLRPGLSKISFIRLARSENAGAEAVDVEAETTALKARVSSVATDLKVEAGGRTGAEKGAGTGKSIMARTRPATALAFFILLADGQVGVKL
jgi:hypothetical protein